MPRLTWLHLSDLHACRARSGWDADRVRDTLVADLSGLEREHGLRPDLIFFTGDAAFGHLGEGAGQTIEEQFLEAAAFLDAVRRAFSEEVPKDRLFLVPGNHDVDRRKVSKFATKWLDDQSELAPVLQTFQEAGFEWQTTILPRLAAYQQFLAATGLDHLRQDPARVLWSTVREVNGLRVGIAGFNSAWSCGRDKEKGRLWAAGDWQQGTLRQKLRAAEAHVSIALMHHPHGWLVEQESHFRDALRQDFQFLLHGHEHKDWVTAEDDGFTTIGAGACYDRSDRPNGYNLVQLDPERGRGEIWLRRYDRDSGGWVERRSKQTDARGVRAIRPAWLRDLAAVGETRSRPPATPSSRRSEPSAGPTSTALDHYLECLRSLHGDLPIAGFASRVRMPIRLESVYVPLTARVIHRALDSEQPKPGAFRELPMETEDREVAFDEALPLAARHGFRGAVVLGDPGTGKSTLLKHFLLCDPSRIGLPPETVPVLVELRHLKAPAAGLRSALTEAVERADPSLDAPAFALALLQRDHLLFLVDGLDEIADAGQRAAVSRWLEEAVARLPRNTFVVTSRYAGYKGDARLSGRFLELHVRDLTEIEARRFIHDWYEAVESHAQLERPPEVSRRLAEAASEELSARIFDQGDPRTASLRRLATIPLMLQNLCLVHRDRSKHLPERRVELYWECCQVLLELWRQAKGMPVTLSATQALKLLQPLAHWLHLQGRKEATAAEVQPLLAAPLAGLGRDPAEAEALLATLRDQSGVLVNVGEAYTFLHLSFQEYLCARHLQDQISNAPGLLKEIAGHFGETWWREVILLALGLDNPGLFEPLMRAILSQEVLHRDASLADDCLRDASSPSPRPLLEALAGGLKSAEERYHALRLLRSLPRWAEALPDGTSGKEIVERLTRDGDPQVQGMVAELLGLPAAAARRVRRQEPDSGEEWRNEIDGTVLLYVPGGEYLLGAYDLTEDERPPHRVVLSPFWIAKYPVTNEQYGQFLHANPGTAEPRFWQDKRFNQPNQPVVGVCWDEAQTYCRWAGLVLPSEAQWEAAARGTDGRRYPWGNDEPTAEHANFGDREGRTTPVGAFPRGAGPFGTLDQSGNVWEWCVDVWDKEAYQRTWRTKEDPVGTSGNDSLRSLRGGSWSLDFARDMAAACRVGGRALGWVRIVGFRCALLYSEP